MLLNKVMNPSSGGTELAVEYIESTGTQWIDTGIIPTNHRVVAKFQYTNKINNYPSLFGMWSAKWDKDYYLTWGNSENKWYYASGMSYEGIISNATQYTDLQEIDFNNYEGKFLINGVEYGDTNGEVNALHTLPIFTRRNNNGGYISVYNCSARLYYFKIYDRATQEPVRDFVPAVDENGVVCLYDNVTKTYFYNRGSGVFKGIFIEKRLTELETLIDESGVLDSTGGTVTEKVEELIDKAKSGSSPSIDENDIVTFGGNTIIDENGIVTL